MTILPAKSTIQKMKIFPGRAQRGRKDTKKRQIAPVSPPEAARAGGTDAGRANCFYATSLPEAPKTGCTRCTCLACTSTCAPRGDFPYKSPEIRPISAQSARLVHRITVPLKFPCTCQTCTITAHLPHNCRTRSAPPSHRPYRSIGWTHTSEKRPGSNERRWYRFRP